MKTKSMIGFWLRLSGLLILICTIFVSVTAMLGHLITTNQVSFTTLYDPQKKLGVFFLDVNRQLSARFIKDKIILLMAWSANGQQIIFVDYYDRQNLYIMDWSGNNVRLLLKTESNVEDFRQIALTPDGQQMALAVFRQGRFDIFLVDLEKPSWNEPLIALRNMNAEPAWPDWSPDGQALVISSNSAVTTLTLGSNSLRQLTGNAGTNVMPDWSPDGKQIVYSSNENVNGNYEIYLINADGGIRRQLTSTSANKFFPQWSRDGKQILFVGTIDQTNYDIYIMDADGGKIRQLTTGRLANVLWYP